MKKFLAMLAGSALYAAIILGIISAFVSLLLLVVLAMLYLIPVAF